MTMPHAYAMDYAGMLRGLAKALELDRTGFSAHLLEPDRDWIEGTLDHMYRKVLCNLSCRFQIALAVFGGLTAASLPHMQVRRLDHRRKLSLGCCDDALKTENSHC